MRLGYVAAIAALAASLAYAIPQLLQAAGLLPTPLDRILIFAPSLALAPCFVVTLAAAYERAAAIQRPWRLAALALAILYAGNVGIVYVNQLGVILPREFAGTAEGFGRFACCGFREPLTAIDLLGYTYMGLAMALLAPTYRGAARRLLLANGLLAPALFLQLFWPWLIWIGALWLLVFPWAMLLIARDFRDADRPE